MTSHFIDLFDKRAAEYKQTGSSSSPPRPVGNLGRSSIEQGELEGESEDGCTFCEIAAGEQEAYKVYEDEFVIAFLDILPIRPGHLLVVPKKHYERVTNLPDETSAAIGRSLPRIARALCRAVKQPDFNIISNQGYAQVVPHVHYHLVPAPLPNSPPPDRRNFLQRNELDDEDGVRLSRLIREELAKEERAKL
ncbi:hypothetical protein JCM5353_003696 [Sporobolomyces roseus]